MYKEYKTYGYNAEINGTRNQLNVRWGNCGRFLTDEFMSIRKLINICLFLKQKAHEYESASLLNNDV